MSFFSRLTDIVTCNLSEILANEEDPQAAIEQIIFEIQEGVAGAQRSLKTATKNATKIEQEIAEHTAEVERLGQQAVGALQQDDEAEARRLLMRKTEQGDLVAGLQHQLESAKNLVAHLTTTERALEARLHDAQRKQQQLLAGELDLEAEAGKGPATQSSAAEPVDSSRSQQIEDELTALKKQLGRG